ncbi:hypothetical protein EDD21DRAFT_67811, partial [Dissophora ornata]
IPLSSSLNITTPIHCLQPSPLNNSPYIPTASISQRLYPKYKIPFLFFFFKNMAATVKAWHRDDCRRLSIDIEQIQYQELKKKLQSTFQLENDFTVKYTDMDGDLCTISGTEEFDDLVQSDMVKERKGTLRLKVIPNGSRRPSILHRRDSSDQSGTSTIGAFFL